MTHDFRSVDITGNYWFICKPKDDFFILEADFTKEKPNVGDTIQGLGCFKNFNDKQEIVEVIENRSSRGVYTNPEMAKDAFYKLKIKRIN